MKIVRKYRNKSVSRDMEKYGNMAGFGGVSSEGVVSQLVVKEIVLEGPKEMQKRVFREYVDCVEVWGVNVVIS